MKLLKPVIILICMAVCWGAVAQIKTDLVAKTNEARRVKALPSLTENPLLSKIAQAHASDMAEKNYFSHTGKDKKSPTDRARDAGFPLSIGENIIKGPQTDVAALQGWMNSPNHRANILNTAYRQIGVGHAEKENKHYWVQVFAASTNSNISKNAKNASVPILVNLPPLPKIPPLPKQILLDGFERGVYQQWRLDGDCWGRGPEDGNNTSLRVVGWSGNGYVSSAHAAFGYSNDRSETGTGVMRSPEFSITHTKMRFRIGGGNLPDVCCMNLMVDGKPVRTATGNGTNRLVETEWDLTDLLDQRARLEIVDSAKQGKRGYILVDDLMLMGVPDRPEPTGNLLAEAVRTGPIMTVEGKLPPPTSSQDITSTTVMLPDGTKITGKKLMVLEATGYGPGENGPWGDRTALGTKVGYGTVAVDPKVIKLRTRLWVEGYGFCVALDTGSAIKGMRIDLGYNDDVTANLYGRKKVKVLILD
jgi:3D (Asp-Asp-Asp) domain-containing protein